MERIFLEKIRKNKITQPTQRGFNLGQWIEDYKNNLSIDDLHIFMAGIVIHESLQEIRAELDSLYKKQNPFSDLMKS